MRFTVEMWTEVEAESYLEVCHLFREFIDSHSDCFYMPEYDVTLDKAPTSEKKNAEHMESLKRIWREEDLGMYGVENTEGEDERY